jgi:hypothetical protein
MGLVAAAIALGDIAGDVVVGAAGSATYEAVKGTFGKAVSAVDAANNAKVAADAAADAAANVQGTLNGIANSINAILDPVEASQVLASNPGWWSEEASALSKVFASLNSVSGLVVDAGTAAGGALLTAEGLAHGISRYSLDAVGLAAYQADVDAGKIVGNANALVATYLSEADYDGRPVPVVNPNFFVVNDPPFDTVLDSRVLLDALNGLYLSKILR